MPRWGRLVGQVGRGAAALSADEHLADDRLGGAGGGAEVGVVRRHRAPAEDLLPLLADDLLEQALAVAALLRRRRQEHRAHAVVARRRQADLQRLARLLEEAVRRLQEDAGAVAGVGLAAAGAA